MDLSCVSWRKSERSLGNGGECVEVGVWHRSSHSLGNGGDRIEVAAGTDHSSQPPPPVYLMRDSKDPDGPKLAFAQAEWASFLHAIKASTVAQQ